MRISDWSSDVCSSDLQPRKRARILPGGLCEDHCRIGRQIAVRGVARRLHRDIAEIQPGRKRAFALKRLEYIEQMPAIGVEKRRQCAAQSRRSRKSGEDRKSTRLNSSH